jgi:ribosomal protein S18 acetylase RimI-like enzyme
MTSPGHTSHLLQLVYRQNLSSRIDVHLGADDVFLALSRPVQAASCQRALRGRFGTIGVLKLMAKLVSHARQFYLIIRQNEVVHYGWISLGQCRWYSIPANAAVIGPIWTAESVRGQGLATEGLKQCMNSLLEQGIQHVYIDTAETNTAAQRVFAKCGFGNPVESFERPAGGLQ